MKHIYVIRPGCCGLSPAHLEGQDRIMSWSHFDPSIHAPTRRPIG